MYQELRREVQLKVILLLHEFGTGNNCTSDPKVDVHGRKLAYTIGSHLKVFTKAMRKTLDPSEAKANN